MMSGSSYDYSFATLTDSTFAKLTAKPKSGLDTTLNYELTGTTFKLMCKATFAPTAALTTSNRITVNYLIGTDNIAFGYDVGFKTGTDPNDRVPETLTTPATDASTSTVKYAITTTDIVKTWND